jgi:glyoxylase I family protein
LPQEKGADFQKGSWAGNLCLSRQDSLDTFFTVGGPMRMEHIGLQVSDPVAMADWYMEHLGFICKRAGDPPVSVRFIADESGQILLEIYHNPTVPTPDYWQMDPLLLHLAFECEEVTAATERLIRAGATLYSPLLITPSGDQLAMLRDPWGLPIQLAHRQDPMVIRGYGHRHP